MQLDRGKEDGFTVKENNGVLKIEEKDKWFIGSTNIGTVTVFVPSYINLEKLKIEAGAGKISIDGIEADTLKLTQGAGMLKVSNSSFAKADINGGAGEMKLEEVEFNDLDLESGVRKSCFRRRYYRKQQT